MIDKVKTRMLNGNVEINRDVGEECRSMKECWREAKTGRKKCWRGGAYREDDILERSAEMMETRMLERRVM